MNDPKGLNAFNERDVNRDGLVDFVDAVTSDKFFNQDYTNIDQALAATGNVRVGDAVTPFNLVDAELNDTGNIDQSDLDVINTVLVGRARKPGRARWIKSSRWVGQHRLHGRNVHGEHGRGAANHRWRRDGRRERRHVHR